MLRPTSVRGLLLFVASLAVTSATAQSTTRLALVGGMLLNGYGGPPVHYATILIENTRIIAAGAASEVVIPPGTQIIDTRGDTMMPGMIEPVPTAAHRVWVLPATREFPERLDDPVLQREFPPDIWAELQESFRQVSALSYFRNHEQEEFNGDASISQWIRAGAFIGMGSDNGSPLNFHKDALWREAKVFVDHGMPVAETITALTLTSARILGRDREVGTIESGKLADITVVKGNPLFDIVALSDVDVVVKNGVPYRGAERIPAAH
jgi:imidazolonepropionase-like amidohydrolase